MATVTFNIPNDRLPLIITAFKSVYPIPLINVGTVENPIWENQFTDNQWAKECIRRWVIKTIARYNYQQEQKAIEAQFDDIVYQEDDDLLT